MTKQTGAGRLKRYGCGELCFKPMYGVAPQYPAACADWFRIRPFCSQNARRISRRAFGFFGRPLLAKDGRCGLIEAVKLVRAQRFAFQQSGEGGGVGAGALLQQGDAVGAEEAVAQQVGQRQHRA